MKIERKTSNDKAKEFYEFYDVLCVWSTFFVKRSVHKKS